MGLYGVGDVVVDLDILVSDIGCVIGSEEGNCCCDFFGGVVMF